MAKHKVSEEICEQLKIDYIDFSKPENFIKLFDSIFKYHNSFYIDISKRTKNFLEDVLEYFLKATKYMMVNHNDKVENLACIIRNEDWS